VSRRGRVGLNGESRETLRHIPLQIRPRSDTDGLLALRSQFYHLLSEVGLERDDLDMALDSAQRAVRTARKELATNSKAFQELSIGLRAEANVLERLGRLDEALERDAEVFSFNPTVRGMESSERLAMRHMARGEDAKAEEILRHLISDALSEEKTQKLTIKAVGYTQRPFSLLAELLERRGTEEALAEARTLRDGNAQRLARHEARRAAALEETRAAAAEAVRQWREERIKARGKKGGEGKGKGKGKKKGRKTKGRGKSKETPAAAATEGELPREPAGEEVEGAAAEEEGAAAEPEQQGFCGSFTAAS
jgi:hypothetical protein